MKAILISPDSTSVIEVENSLDGIQAQVEGMIESLPYPGREDATCYINEEGKFFLRENTAATKILQGSLFPDDYIAGNLIILGFDQNSGDNRDCPEDIIREIIR